jgi:hypothetical protein
MVRSSQPDSARYQIHELTLTNTL